jgi:hypothetical protein
MIPENETVIGEWKIDKAKPRMNALLLFFVPLAIAAGTFIYVFLIERSTNILLVILPILLFLPVIAAFKQLLKVSQIFKEDKEYYVTENGIYLVHKGKNEPEFLAWALMKRYDRANIGGSMSLLDILIPKPIRLILKGETEAETIVVDGYEEDILELEAILRQRQIPFGIST